MLRLVKAFWVEGVLKKSLHGLALIELGMEELAEAIETPGIWYSARLTNQAESCHLALA